ncbi:hypothetical protein SAMN05216337_102057 [Bradyrhizobium brasilense]|uniref:Uncharacterized protein n=1 Tax=Bradyrhizobium brasilense TaxID=1419277 RepID=A0A1G7ADM4_9BRAD|nr:hypothetical protein [Bradyrhizobium brasilense]SDE12135.1 hypothetical protein SAMN05216337_102057 [Bradyrhizobium brasilense]
MFMTITSDSKMPASIKAREATESEQSTYQEEVFAKYQHDGYEPADDVMFLHMNRDGGGFLVLPRSFLK